MNELPKMLVGMALREDGQIEVRVTDNGVGMKSASIVDIFLPGVRGESTSGYSGTGFGLEKCECIVTAHGGKALYESSEGIGTSVYFTLPSAAVNAEPFEEEVVA